MQKRKNWQAEDYEYGVQITLLRRKLDAERSWRERQRIKWDIEYLEESRRKLNRQKTFISKREAKAKQY